MKSRTKKSRKHIRRSALASVLVISSFFGVVQAHAGDHDPDYDPHKSVKTYGTLDVPPHTDTLYDEGGHYGTIRGSAAIVEQGGTATSGGNKVEIIYASGAVVGSYSSVGNDGTARANDNKVSVYQGTHSEMRGGFAETCGNCTTEASGNYLTLLDATIEDGWMATGDTSAKNPYYIATSADVDANDNHLTVSGGSAGKQYVGGYAGNCTTIGGTADASENSISITSSSAPKVIAGWANIENGSGDSNANENLLTISGANSDITEAYSGYAFSKTGGNVNANKNKDNLIYDFATVGTFIAGYAETNGDGDVTSQENSTTVDNATVTTFKGGYAKAGIGDATASSNTNNLSDSAISTVIGGHAEGSGDVTANSNETNVSNNNVASTYVSGKAETFNATATANKNKGTVTGGTYSDLRAGWAHLDNGGTGTTNGNELTLDGVTLAGGFVAAGDSTNYTAGTNATLNSNDNTFTIKGGTASQQAYSGHSYNYGSGSSTATGNTFTHQENARISDVRGGNTYTASGTATSSTNHVYATDEKGGTFDTLYGGYAQTLAGTAVASSNEVSLSKTTSTTTIGGYATGTSSATASSNTVTLSNLSGTTTDFKSGYAYASEANGTVTVESNTATVTGGTYNSLRGAMAQLAVGGTATAKGNTVTLSGVTITGDWTAAGDANTLNTATGDATLSATKNAMTMDGGSADMILGALSHNNANGSSTASNNDLILKNNARATTVIAADAYASNGNTTANENTLTSTEGDGGVYTTVYGGRARTDNGSATANLNSGTLTSATVNGDFVGGLATGITGATTYKNEFTLDKGSYQKVQGGRAETNEGEASSTCNKVTILNNATINGTINGGSAETTGSKATASNNTVEALSGVTLTSRIRVGEAISTATVYASNNTASIKGGTSASYVVGGYGNLSGDTATYAEAKDNVVTVDSLGGNLKGVYGGELQIADSGDGLVEHNTGTLTNITATKFAGGTVYNQSGTVTATRNEFTISKGTYTNMYGGIAEVRAGKDDFQDVAKATSNKIDMTECSVLWGAFGGRAEIKTETSGADTATATSNTLNLNKTSTEEALWLLGGYATVAGTGTATATGNKGTWTNVKYTKDAVTGLAGGGLASVKSGSATASTNIFSLTGGSYTTFVGGKAQVTSGTNVANDTATVSGNQATLKDGTSTSDFTGGLALVSGTGTAKATGNFATFDNVTATSGTFRAAYATTGKGKAEATGNTATVKTGGTYNYLLGGEAEVSAGSASDAATASSNKVVFDNATLAANATVYGGKAYVAGTTTSAATVTADNNTLHIAQSSTAAYTAGNIFGGYADVASTKEGHTLTASTNGIEITNGKYTNIYGGHAVLSGKGSATASNNGANTAASHVGTLTNVTADQFVGGLAEVAGTSATASTNIFTLTKGTYGNATGGQATVTNGTGITTDTATAQGNQITLTGGTSTAGFTGANASVTGTGTATATGNSATLDNATSNGTLTAASAAVDKGIAEASSNTATVKTGGIYNNLIGGEAAVKAGGTASDVATASSNKVVFDDATLANNSTVYGGKALVTGVADQTATAKAEGNTLHIAQASGAENKVGNVFGGYAYVVNTKDGSTVAASTNGIDITNGSYSNIFGGRAILISKGSAVASNNGENTAASHAGRLTDVTADQFVGGLAEVDGTSATASANIFTLANGSYGYATGGQATVTNGTGVTTDTATAQGNRITLSGGTSTKVFTGANASVTGTGTAKATGNSATLDNAVSNGTITAASASVDKGIAEASSNTATVMTGGTYNNLTGGEATVYAGGSDSDTATASSNSVVFDGGSISEGGTVYGGSALVKGADAETATATATQNTVHLAVSDTATAKAGNIYGGVAEVESTKDGHALKANSNGIDITNGTYTSIYGGYAMLAGAGTATADSNGGIASGVTEAGTASNEFVLLATETETVVASSADGAGSEENETVTGTLTNVTTDSFAGGVASVGSGTSTAKSNVFTFEKGLSKNAAGGKAQITAGISSEDDVAQAVSNKLVLNNGTSEEAFTGGIALVSGTGTAKVSDNAVELTDATSTKGYVTGAAASVEGGVSDAHENTVTITGGTYYNVNGGQSITGTGTSESVSNVTSVENAVSAGSVTGGSSAVVKGTALAQKNRALLSGGTYANLFGGQAGVLASYAAATDSAEETSAGQAEESAILLASLDETYAVADNAEETATEETADGSATATENELVVTNASVSGAAAGGYGTIEGTSGSVKVFANSLKMVRAGDGTVSSIGSVNGGLAVAENGSVEVYENSFELDAGTYNDINGSNAVVLGKGTAKATGQVHELNYTAAVQYSGSLVAGKASVGSGQAVATENKLALQGTYTGNVVASQAMVTDASSSSDKASATKSSITVNDAVIYGELHAGFAYVKGSGSTEVSDIELILNGGRYGASISAGYILATDASATATALNDTLVLNPGSDGISPVFNARETVIYGGYATTDGTTSIYANASNITSRFEYVKGMTAANIKGFTNYEFNLPDVRAGETILTLTGGANREATSIANATIKVTVGNVYGRTGGDLQIGDRIYLLKNNNGLDSTGTTLLPVEYTNGVVISHMGSHTAEGLLWKTDGNSLYLTTPDPDASLYGAKAFFEGAAAGLALASEAADSVTEVMRTLDRQEWQVFGRISGGRSRYETGSSINLTTLSMVAGLGKGFDTGAGFLTVGAFLEYGTGSYTTHNSFASRSDVDGDGQSKYMGGGILAKMDFKDTGPGHFYADATAHMGNLHNAFDSNDVTDDSGRVVATFDYDTPYYSVHGSLGYKWDITDKHMLDLYGQYIWTKVEGADVELNIGDMYEFDDMNSNRLRLGATYSYTGHHMFSPYIGAAWEHEFNGKSEAAFYGIDVKAPSFRGDTFRGELGIKTTESKDMPVTLNLGVTGFTGVRNGVSGNFYFRYDF